MGLISLTQFSSTLSLFDNLAYTKYILLERLSNEGFNEHHKITLTAGVIFFVVNNWKIKHTMVFSDGALTTIMDWEP